MANRPGVHLRWSQIGGLAADVLAAPKRLVNNHTRDTHALCALFDIHKKVRRSIWWTVWSYRANALKCLPQKRSRIGEYSKHQVRMVNWDHDKKEPKTSAPAIRTLCGRAVGRIIVPSLNDLSP